MKIGLTIGCLISNNHQLGDESRESIDYKNYNIKGQLITRGHVEQNKKGIEIPSSIATSSYYLVLRIEGKQQGIQFIVKE